MRIKPVPGAGLVYGDAFIPQDDVMNPLSGTDGLNPIPFNRGDNRGFNPKAAPDKSRMSWYIDYERGIVVVRQNVTHDKKDTAAAGNPHVGVEQAADGSTRMRIEGWDALANPAGEAVHGSVKADVVVDPHGGRGSASVNGRVSQYPFFEMYQMRNGEPQSELVQQTAETRPLGTPESWGMGPFIGLSMYPNVELPGDPAALQRWYAHYHPAQGAPRSQRRDRPRPGPAVSATPTARRPVPDLRERPPEHSRSSTGPMMRTQLGALVAFLAVLSTTGCGIWPFNQVFHGVIEGGSTVANTSLGITYTIPKGFYHDKYEATTIQSVALRKHNSRDKTGNGLSIDMQQANWPGAEDSAAPLAEDAER